MKVGVVATMLNLTPRRVQQLAQEGVIPRGQRGLYNLAGCVRGYITYLQDKLEHAKASEQPSAELRDLELRGKLADVQVREARARKVRGELVTIAAFEAELEHYASLVRAQHVAAPNAYADRFPELPRATAMTRLAEIFDEIEGSLQRDEPASESAEVPEAVA